MPMTVTVARTVHEVRAMLSLPGRDVSTDHRGKYLSDYPKLLAQLVSEIDASTIRASSSQRLMWRCDVAADHVWETQVRSRTYMASGCACCTGKQPSITNRLDVVSPEIALSWHPTKNGRLTPSDVTVGSGRRVWWRCDRGPDHEWEATPAARVQRARGCPHCDGKQVSVTNGLVPLFPEVAAEWHPTKNYSPASEFTARTRKKAWWQCSTDRTHSWNTSIGLPLRERTPRDQAARVRVWARSQVCGASMSSAE
jgi:hypothetical protein